MIWHVLAGAGVGAAGGAAAGSIGAMLGSVIGGLLGAFAAGERTAGARSPTDDELRRAVCPMQPDPSRTPTPDELIAMTAALANRPTAEQIAEAGRRGVCRSLYPEMTCPPGHRGEPIGVGTGRWTCVPDGTEAPPPGRPPPKKGAPCPPGTHRVGTTTCAPDEKPLPDRFPTTVKGCPDGYEFKPYGIVLTVVGAPQGECVRFGADDDFVYGGFSGLRATSRR